jgi:phosphotransferase system HPr (HPr) family protein
MRMTRTLQIDDIHGLHARPAALFVKAVDRFQADIIVRCGECSASGKSVLSLLILGVRPGDVLTVIAEGPDAAAAMQALDYLFQRQPKPACGSRQPAFGAQCLGNGAQHEESQMTR